VPIQSEEGADLLADLAESRRLESWHLALPSREVLSGGAAIGPLAAMLPRGKPLAVLAERFPKTTDRCYRFVASHRDRFATMVGADASCEVRR
jgi:predicted DCC family thiol-disulfide oxidoreductase YuxK